MAWVVSALFSLEFFGKERPFSEDLVADTRTRREGGRESSERWPISIFFWVPLLFLYATKDVCGCKPALGFICHEMHECVTEGWGLELLLDLRVTLLFVGQLRVVDERVIVQDQKDTSQRGFKV